MSHQSRIVRGAASAFALVGVTVGVPWGLWALVGWPLPRTVPSWDQVTQTLTQSGVADALLLDALAIVCWLAWAVVFACVVNELLAAARGRSAPRLPLAGSLQTLAASLVAAAILVVVTTSSRSAPSSHPTLTTVLSPSRSVATQPVVTAELHGRSQSVPAIVSTTEAATLPEYIVKPRDTLWGIADGHLGDPMRWPEIFELNKGRVQADGSVLVAGRLIRPGWVLQLPTATAPAPVTDVAIPSPHTPPPLHRPQEVAQAAVPIPASDGSASTATHSQWTTEGQPAKPASRATSVIVLPSGSIVGATIAAGIGTALVGARLQRRRRRLPGDPDEGVFRSEPHVGAVVRRLRRAQLECPLEPGSPPSGFPAAVLTAPDVTPTGGDDSADPTRIELVQMGGLALTGEGAAGVTRAAILTVLTVPEAEVRIADPLTAGMLFSSADNFPTFEVATDLDHALSSMEVELLQRTRMLDSADAADAAEFRVKRPYEPFPFTLLVASDAAATAQGRLDTIIGLGRRLDLGVLVLNAPSSATSVAVRCDGVVNAASGEHATGLAGAQLFTLTIEAATECLATVAESRGVEPAELSAPEETVPPTDVAIVVPERTSSEEAAPHPVDIKLLGAVRVEANGEVILTGFRTKARELLAYLVLHPQGVTADVAVDTLLPDADPDRGMDLLRTVIGNVRKVLRDATGRSDSMFIERRGDRYVLDAALIDSDYWRFELVLARAADATDGPSRVAALDAIRAECGGELVDGSPYEWAETIREDVRRRAVDGLVRLAELHSGADDSDRALTALEHALRADPYCEDLYRRIMQIHAGLERPDAIRRTYRLLERRLAELDADPDDLTTALLYRLTSRPASASA